MGLEGCIGVEWNVDAGELLEIIEEGWIAREAKIGERPEGCGIFGIAGGEHSGGGGGCLGERLPLVQYGNTEAAAVEFKREREADNSSARDADIGVTHKTSLV